MLVKMFSVYDSKAQVYTPPFYFKAVGEAVRAFQDSVNTPGHQFNKWPGDFTLFQIGAYDDETGFVTQDQAHINLGVALEFFTEPGAFDAPTGPVFDGLAREVGVDKENGNAEA